MKRKEPGQFQGLDSRTSKFISVLMEAEPEPDEPDEPDEPEWTLIKNQHTLWIFFLQTSHLFQDVGWLG